MRSRLRAALLAVVMAAVVSACGGRAGGPLGIEYEYEEDLTLSLDGSATLVVNASIPALVALRGLPLDTELKARADALKEQLRTIYSSENTRVGRISNWTRRGRRFVGIHLTIADIRALPNTAPFSWASYDLHEEGDQVIFRQTLSTPAASAPLPADSPATRSSRSACTCRRASASRTRATWTKTNRVRPRAATS